MEAWLIFPSDCTESISGVAIKSFYLMRPSLVTDIGTVKLRIWDKKR